MCRGPFQSENGVQLKVPMSFIFLVELVNTCTVKRELGIAGRKGGGRRRNTEIQIYKYKYRKKRTEDWF